jgi:hypothetical protein
MAWRTSTELAGRYLVITPPPPRSTDQQVSRAFEVAQRIFDEAGVDRVEPDYRNSSDPDRVRFLPHLWEAAEKPPTAACWPARSDMPKPTRIKMYFERRETMCAVWPTVAVQRWFH